MFSLVTLLKSKKCWSTSTHSDRKSVDSTEEVLNYLKSFAKVNLYRRSVDASVTSCGHFCNILKSLVFV